MKMKNIDIKKLRHNIYMYSRGYKKGLSIYGTQEDNFNMPGRMRRGMSENYVKVWYKRRFFVGRLIKKEILYK